MAPYAAGARSIAGWNSSNCGQCYSLKSDNGTEIFVTAVDAAGGDHDFNLSEEAFDALFGAGATKEGHNHANWTEANATSCKGNLGSK